MEFVSIDQIIHSFDFCNTDVAFAKDVLPYHKRWYKYSSHDRVIDLQEISYIVKGHIHGDINGESVELGAGDLFWLRPFTPHSLTWDNDLIYYSLRFSLKINDKETTIGQPVIIIKNVTALEQVFRNIVIIINEKNHGQYRDKQIKANILLLFANIADNIHNKANEHSVRMFTDLEKGTILDYCINNRFIDVDSNVLSAKLGLSRDYFSRVFKSTYMQSARSWIFIERMKLAAGQLIDTDLSIDEIAELLGYCDIYLFSRQFKKVMGVTPTQYRRKNNSILLDKTAFLKDLK